MAEPQREPTTKELEREIASVDRDITQQLFYGGGKKIMVNADETLRTRGVGKGLKLYDELERDPHLAALLAKRKSETCKRDWEVEPASADATDVEIAAFVEQCLEDLRFDQFTREALDATLKGYSVLEIMWAVRENRLVPAYYIARNQDRFRFDDKRKPRLLTAENAFTGEELPDRKFVVHAYGGKDGTPYGIGLGSKLFWPVFFKRQNITFWLIFNDKFGSPTALGKYPAGTPTSDQEKLLQALRAISHDAAIGIPIGMEVDLLEAARTGGGDGYEKLCRYMDEQMSAVVLGGTLTTTVSSTGGNRALGEVHQGALDALAKEDADNLSDTLNESLIKWIVDLNFPGREAPTVWRVFDEPEDLDKIALRDKTLHDIGIQRTDESIQEVYGPGFVRKEPPAPGVDQLLAASFPGAGHASFSERRKRGWIRTMVARLLGFAEREAGDAVTQQGERLDKETADLADAWVKQVKKLLDEASTLEEFRDGLLKLHPDMPADEFAEVMRKGLAAAALAGRFDIVERAG